MHTSLVYGPRRIAFEQTKLAWGRPDVDDDGLARWLTVHRPGPLAGRRKVRVLGHFDIADEDFSEGNQ